MCRNAVTVPSEVDDIMSSEEENGRTAVLCAIDGNIFFSISIKSFYFPL